ncbi:LpqN/LpqT family lipoprotein [Mycobacterium sp. ITM-2016-00318]|uniref:LpqN/LpqT family lipoprotein n=1 Tax=Mycobacterium sp. ITM-2016-00318 TaxID=2099693 RepID=UPI000CF9CDDB|nr:LpqN/LpqT family lipoprotein [Mycobacterium sp. ITM-2016-00318]WNG92908.1 LpqN/LpqT family lipoprotein [Mycobacterium sp. ITM-2016-00318]
MIGDARRWRILAGAVAAGMAGVLGVTANTAAAEPLYPLPPQPSPASQPVTVMPGSAQARQSTGQLGIAPAAPAAQSLATPALPPGAAVPAPQTLIPANSQTLNDYFHEKGIKLEPQAARDFTALNIVLPVPRGWSQVPDPNVPDAFAVLADRVGGDGIYTSNAALVVYKLAGGDFDPKEAITHGFIDSQLLPAWSTTNASLADFGGMPSAMIEGSYRDNNMSLNTARRHTIATSGQDSYLVSLAVTTTVREAVPTANATDAITNGFRITAPGAPAVPAPAAPAAAAAAAPALAQAPPR